MIDEKQLTRMEELVFGSRQNGNPISRYETIMRTISNNAHEIRRVNEFLDTLGVQRLTSDKCKISLMGRMYFMAQRFIYDRVDGT